MNKAIFLDRDGTINSDEGHYYIYKVEDFVFNPGVIDGIRRLNEAGYLIIVVTNQGGVAKGEYTIEDVENLHVYMCKELEKHGAHVDKIYYCPHHSSIAPCKCRKPSPYMIEQAIRGNPRLKLNLTEVFRPGLTYTIDTLKALRERRLPESGELKYLKTAT